MLLRKAGKHLPQQIAATTTTIHILPRDVYKLTYKTSKYEDWNFNFGNTALDWIQELLE